MWVLFPCLFSESAHFSTAEFNLVTLISINAIFELNSTILFVFYLTFSLVSFHLFLLFDFCFYYFYFSAFGSSPDLINPNTVSVTVIVSLNILLTILSMFISVFSPKTRKNRSVLS